MLVPKAVVDSVGAAVDPVPPEEAAYHFSVPVAVTDNANELGTEFKQALAGVVAGAVGLG